MNLTLLVVVALLVINLLLLVWLLKRPVSSPDQALALLPQELQSHADAQQVRHAQTERGLREVREELQRSASGTRQELTQSLGQAIGLFQQTVLGQQGDATRTQNEQLDSFRVQLAAMQQALADALRDSSHQAGLQASAQREAQALALARFTEAQEASLKRLSDAMGEQLRALSESNDRRLGEVRTTVETRLQALQADNEKKLEQMRQTVDEKLHATLEARLGESFKQVADRLEQVHKGLGEMQGLAQGVGDLKRVLTNVKSRGVFGEVQLAGLLEQVFTIEQYAVNVATVPGSNERVEFAIKLPGRSDSGEPVWLPMDAKFPREDYERLLDAQDRADRVDAEAAGKALEQRIRIEAKTIATKYLAPPHTTDFAILFLPTEGLYAELLRRPGLTEALQREHRVVLAGPTTLLATLNSLQMGFRTLALEKRSTEVWQVLGAVKTEFAKFGDVLAKTRKKLDEASRVMDDADRRARVMSKALRDVVALPDKQAQALLPGHESALDEGDLDALI
ncbi:MAG: DNA recombination protein RmuC [Aquabacterium commune]|uniref:DNA recombination protein RmuC n=1 Tax=Aquabacterium TaxID=92793 RepID=UPI001D21BBC6|nr:DNA recombination protein RmuC [Aquabacterium sp.]MBT9609196.1 DNA recombination protein RmuC [Aquabacterium sp.]